MRVRARHAAILAQHTSLACLFLICVDAVPGAASNLLELPADTERNPRISGLWYLSYVHEEIRSGPGETDPAPDISRFEIQRGYLTYRTTITPVLRARITSDISVDQEGDGLGDVELRLKYGYVELDVRELGLLRKGRFRAGLLQTPWLDFEQEVNDFRVQGQMFLDRVSVYSSADYGIGYFADLGAPMDEDFRRDVDRRHSARWGSIAVGLYNGGGYDEIEQNDNLVIQARLTIRALPDLLPGLQLSAGFADGRGNTIEAPDYRSTVVMLSHEARWGVLTVTGYDGVGDLLGDEVGEDGASVDQSGISIFGEIRFLRRFSGLGRFDLLRLEYPEGDRDTERWIAGVAWRCIPGGQLLVDYEIQNSLGEAQEREHDQVKLALEVRF